MYAGGAAKAEQAETPRIDTPANGHDANALRQLRIDDTMNAGCGLDGCHPQLAAQFFESRERCILVEPATPAGEVVGIEISQYDTGVSDGRLSSTARIADRTRNRPGTLWSNFEQSAGLYFCNGASAGAQRDNVQARQCDAFARHRPVL